VEIIVAVPFKPVAGDSALVDHRVYDLRDTSGQRGFWERQAVAHRVTESDLYDLLRLLRQAHQLLRERDYEAFEVGSRDIFQMTPHPVQTGVERG
jgi:hypothetical protein